MPNALDFVFVALIAVAWPLYEHFVDWPRFQRALKDDARRARTREYAKTMAMQWIIVAAGVALWVRAERPWGALGLGAPAGWRLWATIVAVALLAALYASQAAALARSAEARTRVRKAVDRLEGLLPHTAPELRWFLALSVTAGVCEELLFRGYAVWTFAPWLGWWGAAALATACFGLLHAYQGRSGIVRTAIVGGVMVVVVALTRSLVPAMALHALIDVGSGVVTWLALRESDATFASPLAAEGAEWGEGAESAA
jgi:membrane protease YdiL (CAAX protease family)